MNGLDNAKEWFRQSEGGIQLRRKRGLVETMGIDRKRERRKKKEEIGVGGQSVTRSTSIFSLRKMLADSLNLVGDSVV